MASAKTESVTVSNGMKNDSRQVLHTPFQRQNITNSLSTAHIYFIGWCFTSFQQRYGNQFRRVEIQVGPARKGQANKDNSMYRTNSWQIPRIERPIAVVENSQFSFAVARKNLCRPSQQKCRHLAKLSCWLYLKQHCMLIITVVSWLIVKLPFIVAYGQKLKFGSSGSGKVVGLQTVSGCIVSRARNRFHSFIFILLTCSMGFILSVQTCSDSLRSLFNGVAEMYRRDLRLEATCIIQQ